jgi:transposase
VTSLEGRLNKNSKNSDKPPSSDGLSKPPRQRSKSKHKPGGQKGRAGKTLKFSANPDKIIQHSADYCQDCDESLVNVEGAVLSRRQEIEIPEKPIQIIEHQRLEKQCPCWGQRNQGEWPAHLTGKVQYGRRVKAFCLYLLNYQLLPYERTDELLETRFGYQHGGGTLQSILDQAYAALNQAKRRSKGRSELRPSATVMKPVLRSMVTLNGCMWSGPRSTPTITGANIGVKKHIWLMAYCPAMKVF